LHRVWMTAQRAGHAGRWLLAWPSTALWRLAACMMMSGLQHAMPVLCTLLAARHDWPSLLLCTPLFPGAQKHSLSIAPRERICVLSGAITCTSALPSPETQGSDQLFPNRHKLLVYVTDSRSMTGDAHQHHRCTSVADFAGPLPMPSFSLDRPMRCKLPNAMKCH
jgi:hypothetical protein